MTLAMSHHLGLTSSFLSSALSGDRLDFLPSMDVYHLLTAGRGALGGGVVGGGHWKRWETRVVIEVLGKHIPMTWDILCGNIAYSKTHVAPISKQQDEGIIFSHYI